MQKLRLIIYLAIVALSTGYGFFKLKTSCYYPTMVTVLVGDVQNDVYQLFYNAGFGINERESVFQSFEKEKGNLIEFEIPGGKISQLRIDPGTKASTIRIQKISVSHNNNEKCWHGTDLEKYFTPFHHIAGMRVENEELIIETTGNDPYFMLTTDINKFIDFSVNWAKVVFLAVKILLFLFLAFGVVYYFHQIYQFIFPRISNWVFLQKIKPQNLFAVIAVVWGLLSVFITPPFQVPDENSHFFRAYQISGLNIMPKEKDNGIGGYVPESILKLLSNYTHLPFHPDKKTSVKQILKDFNIPLNPEKQVFTYHINSAQYIPVPYFPQALAIAIPRLLHAPPLVILYIGRIGNLLFWIFLVYFAVSITPVHKWVFVLTALLPMSVFQAASLSPDAFTFGLSFLFTANVLKLAYDDSFIIGWRNTLVAVFLAIFLALSKNTYFLLVMLVLMIPVARFKTKWDRIFFLFFVFSATFLALILSKVYLDHVISALDTSNGLYSKFVFNPQNVQPYQQLGFIFQNIWYYFRVLFTTLASSGRVLVYNFIGTLGWLDISLPQKYYYWAIFSLLGTALFDNHYHVKMKLSDKLLIVAVVIGVIGTICTLLYLTWTPFGFHQVQGLQGRYFIPVGPLFFMLLYNQKIKIQKNFLHAFVVLVIVIAFVVTMFSMVTRYYQF